jgi:hypothetical protein
MSEKKLRNAVIKLAHEKPELRKELLPLLQKTAGSILEPGDVFHFTGGRNYGIQGKVISVDDRGGMVPGVDWKSETGSRVSSLVSDYEVKKGKAPRNMPWRPDSDRRGGYLGRVNGTRYKVWAGVGGRWHTQPELWPKAWFPSAKEAMREVESDG